ncbi:MAG: hypothetical protein ACI4PQ_08695 [Butyricicoccaceae bacterium]
MGEVTKAEGMKFAFRYLNGSIKDIKKKKGEHFGICGPGMPGVDCSPKGVRIWGLSDSDDIRLTWDRFVELRDQEEQMTLF